MAYEPTKNFRQLIRQLMPGDEVIAVGSYKKGQYQFREDPDRSLARSIVTRPPLCTACNKRMTSDGKGKGYKCKKCGARADEPEVQETSRSLVTGWYEVPPTARRHWQSRCAGESRNSDRNIPAKIFRPWTRRFVPCGDHQPKT
jgi:tRNA(Ile2)-agmatinylcytidine synthase